MSRSDQERGSYNGEYFAGRRHGRGIQTYPNGQTYFGDWRNDYRHGRGSLADKENGKVVYGIWENDVFKSHIVSYQNGSEYIGNLDRDGKKFGFGEMHLINGAVVKGNWIDNSCKYDDKFEFVTNGGSYKAYYETVIEDVGTELGSFEEERIVYGNGSCQVIFEDSGPAAIRLRGKFYCNGIVDTREFNETNGDFACDISSLGNTSLPPLSSPSASSLFARRRNRSETSQSSP